MYRNPFRQFLWKRQRQWRWNTIIIHYTFNFRCFAFIFRSFHRVFVFGWVFHTDCACVECGCRCVSNVSLQLHNISAFSLHTNYAFCHIFHWKQLQQCKSWKRTEKLGALKLNRNEKQAENWSWATQTEQ